MGQTLTHGIYLPDEGERNCYNGLAANWSILNGAVGTIAEHTSALSGKAPLVHTHTKSDITDFPAYGTTAGTICEGNDSRLSDARTPVAHTHTKSDVTDLFNSANTWTSLNTYNGMILLKSSSDVTEQFKQKLPKDVSVSTDALVRFNTLTDSEDHNVIVEALGHWSNYVSKSTSLKYKNDSTKQGTIDFRLESSGSGLFYPQSPFECYLGNSSNQWKSVYAQSYYYNGTAWGLDKANVWSANNSFYGITIYGGQTNIFQSNSSVGEKGDASVFALNIQAQDKNHAGWASSGVANIGMGQDQNGSYMSFALETIDSNNTRRNNALSFLLKPTDNSHDASFFPNRNNSVELGTSTNKWKSLNGSNPGALSLPNINYTEGSPDVYNVGTDINNLTKNTTDPLHFSWTSPFDGWLSIMWYLNGIQPPYNVLVTTGDSRYSKFSQTWSASSARWYLATTFPVLKNVTYYFDIDFQNTTIGVVHHAYLLPCIGNV